MHWSKRPSDPDADPASGYPQAAFDDLIRETVLQLANDGVRYSEQSTGINKLTEKIAPSGSRQRSMASSSKDVLPGEIDIKMLG